MENEIKRAVLEELKQMPFISEGEIRDRIVDRVLAAGRDLDLSMEERNRLVGSIFNGICRYGPIQALLEDGEISEIMINGPEVVFYERGGSVYRDPGRFEGAEQLENIIQTMVGRQNRIVNHSQPIVDVRLEDGSRVNVVLGPVALGGPVVTIRKFLGDLLSMEDLLEKASITQEAVDFLKELTVCRYNLFVSGGTSSGKTTFLNLLSSFIPKEERIITIEDSAELNLPGVENLVRLESRNGNLEGVGGISIRQLIRTALRMRPDRIIVGEVRGEEAFDMLTAMNTGHDGSLSTGHANSSQDMLLRLVTMVVMGSPLQEEVAARLIRSGIDILIHLSREGPHRQVVGIYEMEKEGSSLSLAPLFERRGKGPLERTGNLRNLEKMILYGGRRWEDEHPEG